jgi:hypothetical protein
LLAARHANTKREITKVLVSLNLNGARDGRADALGNSPDRHIRQGNPPSAFQPNRLENSPVLHPLDLLGGREPVDPRPVVHAQHKLVRWPRELARDVEREWGARR